MAGYDLAYYYVMRLSDGWYMLDSFTEGNDAIMDLIDTFKGHVDAYLANKSDYEEETNQEGQTT